LERQTTVSERHNNILKVRDLDFQQKHFKYRIKNPRFSRKTIFFQEKQKKPHHCTVDETDYMD